MPEYHNFEELTSLDGLDFNIVLGIDWLAPQKVMVDDYVRTISLAIP